MRVLFVTQDFPPAVGGIQTYSWKVAQELQNRVSAFSVVAPDQAAASNVDGRAPFPVHRVSGRPDLLPIAGVPRIVQCARSLPADVALHAQWQTVGASLVSQWITGWPRYIACVAHGRELLFNPARTVPPLRSLYEELRRRLLKRCDATIPVSRYTGSLLRSLGVPSDRIHVVPNGTDPTRFHPVEDATLRDDLGIGDAPLLLSVARLVPRKGFDTVLHALPAIAEAVPDVHYVVAGTGPDRGRLESIAERKGVRSRVHFAGHVDHDQLPRYYSTADLFVMPARNDPPDVEGFGIVFLEANACETPVIGARSGGIPDAIEDGVTGRLVPPNSPSALAESAIEVLGDPGLAREMGRRGRERVTREASWEHVADRVFQVLTNLP